MKTSASHRHPSRQARRRASRSVPQHPSLAEKYLPFFHRAYDLNERANPHWRLDVLGSLIKSALVNLRHGIEGGRNPALSWDNPCMVRHHPVEWDWQPRDATGVPRGGYLFGNFTAQNTVDMPTARQTVGDMLRCCQNAEVLANATNWSWYEQRGNRTTPCLPAELSEPIMMIRDEGVRRSLIERCLRPFVFSSAGGEDPEIGSYSIPQLPEPERRRATPCVTFQGETNGRSLTLPLIFEIHPLVADSDRREAYHPIVVGFDLGPDDNGNGGTSRTPAGWPPADRATWWDELLEQADKLPALLRAQAGGVAQTGEGGEEKPHGRVQRTEARRQESEVGI